MYTFYIDSLRMIEEDVIQVDGFLYGEEPHKGDHTAIYGNDRRVHVGEILDYVREDNSHYFFLVRTASAPSIRKKDIISDISMLTDTTGSHCSNPLLTGIYRAAMNSHRSASDSETFFQFWDNYIDGSPLYMIARRESNELHPYYQKSEDGATLLLYTDTRFGSSYIDMNNSSIIGAEWETVLKPMLESGNYDFVSIDYGDSVHQTNNIMSVEAVLKVSAESKNAPRTMADQFLYDYNTNGFPEILSDEAKIARIGWVKMRPPKGDDTFANYFSFPMGAIPVQKPEVIGNYQYTGYKCPTCNRRLYKVIFPEGRDPEIEAQGEVISPARIFTCPECFVFFAAPKGSKLIGKDVYVREQSLDNPVFFFTLFSYYNSIGDLYARRNE